MKLLVVVVGLVVGLASAAYSQERDVPLVPLTTAQESQFGEISAELKCPVCKSQSLAASTSYMAEEMKRQIRLMIKDGKSKDEIIEFFIVRYSDWILLKPRVSGISFWLYAVPLAGLLVGLLSWILWTRGARNNASEPVMSDSSQIQPEAKPVSVKSRAKSLIDKEITS